MSERGPSSPQATPTETGIQHGQRLPYEPPAVISEEVFETLALSCAKANPFACPGGNPDRS
jgi:hypothetical protein